MPKYVDGFVVPVPKKNVTAYRKMAALGCKVWMEHGALAYYECAGDDLEPQGMPGVSFTKLAKAKAGETVIFAFIVYRSKAHRNAVNKKVMNDKRMKAPPKGMPFDMKSMTFGGFSVLVSKD